jgi:hypothetical protein
VEPYAAPTSYCLHLHLAAAILSSLHVNKHTAACTGNLHHHLAAPFLFCISSLSLRSFECISTSFSSRRASRSSWQRICFILGGPGYRLDWATRCPVWLYFSLPPGILVPQLGRDLLLQHPLQSTLNDGTTILLSVRADVPRQL